ncbi:hypothetical protein AaE_009489 [Aphanomyces astaci]|uniref:phenylalanine--tRNA ligase n=1 Tax=Aphanomyces astaci TaxID=112090 RepID=A0A6A5AC48_APHAT|nr:hypothetical protein AaE_009489 [Aphanomyces astaci]
MLHRALSAAPRTRQLLHASLSTASSRYPSLITGDAYNNVSESIASKVGLNLHRQPNHPLNIIKTKIASYFDDLHAKGNHPRMQLFDNLSPVVSVEDCFDHMLIPKDHVSRRPTDTYYLNPSTLLRTHTSCHEVPLMKKGIRNFLVAGDVYRRDEIDASHYPVFHQMEGLRFFPELSQAVPYDDRVAIVQEHLKSTLEGMVESIFGKVEMRWVDAYFPFTHPSLELEIFFEVRGANGWKCSGVASFRGKSQSMAVLFDIPDIRLFWSTDARFLSQFKDGVITQFKPYSKYPPCYKDVSFWLAPDFHENNLFEVVRNVAGDMVEQVSLVDEFTHPKTQRSSKCFRITYRHLDRNLTNEEVDDIQVVVRDALVKDLGVELR